MNTRLPARALLLVSFCTALALGSTAGCTGSGAQKKNGDVVMSTKPTDSELRGRLTPEQYKVTQEEGTERPFQNQYWDTKEPGIYVDVVSGEPLFSSLDKFDSGTGWPSFTKPLEPQNLALKEDRTLFQSRTEVRSKGADSHLGHLFDDGPEPTGQRYCMNSAALRFVPAARLEAEGYGQYRPLFEQKKADEREVAILAGGCFWGVEELLRKLPGVVETTVGYTGGHLPNPTYGDVKRGNTGHAEAVRVVFDPSRLSYEALLEYFFRLHDPTTPNQQGNDIGTQYRSSIFVTDEKQKEVARNVIEKVERSGKWKRKIVTEIGKASPFYTAEDYHQDYLEKNPGGYTCHYVRD